MQKFRDPAPRFPRLRPAPATDLSRTKGAAAGGQSVTIPAHAFDPHIVQVAVEGTPMEGAHITQVSAGVTHALALSSEGEIFGWGSNEHRRLGRTGSMANEAPVAIPAPVAMVDIAAGPSISAALGEDGELYTWGAHTGTRDSNISGDGKAEQGPKGLTSTHTGNEFGLTDTPAGTWIAHGEEYTLRLTADGEVLTSGTDNLGGMGIKTNTRVKDREQGLEEPTAIPELENIAMIDAGENHSVALTELGAIFEWGVPTIRESPARRIIAQRSWSSRGTNRLRRCSSVTPRLPTSPLIARVRSRQPPRLTTRARWRCGLFLRMAPKPYWTASSRTPSRCVHAASPAESMALSRADIAER